MKRSQTRAAGPARAGGSARAAAPARATRSVRGVASSLGAAVLLIALVFGSPAALLAWGRPEVLRRLPGALTAPDDGSLLLGLMTLVGWAAWLVFTLCVTAETINLVAGMRGRLTLRVRLPWLGGVQGIAAGLLVASLAMLMPIHQGGSQTPPSAVAAAQTVPGTGDGRPAHGPTASEDPAGPDRVARGPESRAAATEPSRVFRASRIGTAGQVGSPGPAGHAEPSGAAGKSGPGTQAGHVPGYRDGPAGQDDVAPAAAEPTAGGDGVDHLVGPMDSLWSLAEQWYGDGTGWRRIAAANPGVDPSSLPVGRTITIPGRGLSAQSGPAHTAQAGPSRVVPADAAPVVLPADAGPTRSGPAGSASSRPAGGPEPPVITVRAGDTLSGLARTHLGDAERWPEIYRLNRDVIADPDEIDIGWRLHLPASAGAAGRAAAAPGGAQAPAVPRNLPLPDDDHADDKAEQSGNGTTSAGSGTTASGTGQAGGNTAGTNRAEDSAAGSDAGSAGGGAGSAEPGGAGSGRVPSAAPDAGDESPVDDETPTADLVRTALAGLSVFLAGAISGALVAGRRSQLFVRRPGRRVPRLGGADAGLAATMARARDLVSGGRANIGSVPGEATAGSSEPLLPGEGTAGPSGPTATAGPSEPVERPGPLVPHSRPEVRRDPRPVDPDDLPPASVVLGADRDERPVLLDLARTDGWLAICGEPSDAAAMVSSVALSLTCTRWSEGLEVVAVGPGLAWLGGAGREDVVLAEPDEIAEELAALVGRERLSEVPGAPEQVKTPEHAVPVGRPPVTRAILMDADPFDGPPGTPMPDPAALRSAGVVLVSPLSADLSDATAVVVHLDGSATARLGGRTFVPQLVAEPVRRGIVTLVEATGTDRTDPASWWDHDVAAREQPAAAASASSGLPAASSSPSATASPAAPRRPAPDGPAEPIPIRPLADRPPPARPEGVPARLDAAPAPPRSHRSPARALSEEADVSPGTTRDTPVLNVLGTVELTGARGPQPPKGRQQCLEYCAWILCHPGAGSARMRSALMVAEPTRRSNTSRLRRWLGTDDAGRPYLPEAYDGVIRMSDAVGTDWERAQVLLTGGVNRAADGNLRAVLELVRGAPMADAAPGQWHWAEEWRTEMVQTIRDVAVELAGRARVAGDLRTARFALDRALVCCPEDEELLCEKIRVAHLAGDRQEVERLVYITARMARRLGVDLSEETVVLLQEAMEGQARARVI